MTMDWMGLKGLASDLGLAKDALHVYAAVAIQVAAALLCRRSLGHWLPWTIVLLAELLNEAGDMWFGEEARVQQWQIDGAVHDVLNTMILPTLLLLLSRFAPTLFQARISNPNAGTADPNDPKRDLNDPK